MKYVGSKGKHARSILPIVLRDRRADQAYVEPFVGGASMLSAVSGRRIAGDLHAPLIAMWQAVARGWSPRSHQEVLDSKLYARCKLLAKQGSLDPIVAFMGFSLSFGGKWFGGFRNDPSGRRDYVAEALRAADDQFPRSSVSRDHRLCDRCIRSRCVLAVVPHEAIGRSRDLCKRILSSERL